MAAQSSDPGRNPLSIAINNVSHEKLRSLFIAICEKVPEARQQAQSELLIETDSVPIGDNEEQEPEPEARIRYADCANCKKEFDTTNNLEISCRYHPKRSEPTEEMYVDNYDEFEVDTEEMRGDFPEHFEFQCCNDTLKDNPDGCVISFHVEVIKGSDKAGSGRTAVQAPTKPIPSEGTKRLISRYARCVNCEEEFDTTEISKKSCRYHPDDPEVVEEAFPDTDEWMEIDTEENRENFPEGFLFPCCEETLEKNPKGCVVDFHVPFEDGSSDGAKRARVY